jgi:hypothetical protein
MCERVEGKVDGVETPVGTVPKAGDLDVGGLKISDAEMAELLRIDVDGWKSEVPEIEEFLNKAGDRLPDPMKAQLAELKKKRVGGSGRRAFGTYTVSGNTARGPMQNPGTGTGEIVATVSGSTMALDFIEHWHTPYKTLKFTGVKI